MFDINKWVLKIKMSVNFAKIVLIGFIASMFLFVGCNRVPSGYYDEFAKCLTDKGTVMYGAFWCPHCQRTKKNFGDSFKYINYVECDPRGDNGNPELCQKEKIEGYDTWRFADGSELIGEPAFEDMSAITGCTLPQ